MSLKTVKDLTAGTAGGIAQVRTPPARTRLRVRTLTVTTRVQPNRFS